MYTESRSVLLNRLSTTAFAHGNMTTSMTTHRLMKLDFVDPLPPFIQYSLWRLATTSSNRESNALMISDATLSLGIDLAAVEVELRRRVHVDLRGRLVPLVEVLLAQPDEHGVVAGERYVHLLAAKAHLAA